MLRMELLMHYTMEKDQVQRNSCQENACLHTINQRYCEAGDGMMNDYQKRLPSIGHGYASMPHSFKHGYGNPFRQQRLMAMQQQRLYVFPCHWHQKEGRKHFVFCFFLRKKMKKFSSIETFFNTLPSSWYLPSLLEMKMMFIFLR